MGLEDFSSDDNNSSSNNSSASSTSKVGPSEPVNKPSYTSATFADDRIATPRAIKYQIKSQGGKWKYQFSQLRLERGELVMCSAGHNTSQGRYTLAVFTTIQSEIDEITHGDELDIWVVPWDLKRSNNLDSGAYISADDSWATKLCGAVSSYIDNLDEYIE